MLIIYITLNLLCRVIGPRSRVWSEKEMVDAAACEFTEVCFLCYWIRTRNVIIVLLCWFFANFDMWMHYSVGLICSWLHFLLLGHILSTCVKLYLWCLWFPCPCLNQMCWWSLGNIQRHGGSFHVYSNSTHFYRHQLIQVYFNELLKPSVPNMCYLFSKYLCIWRTASFKTLFLIVLLPGVDQFLSSQPSRSIFSRVEKQGKLEGELLNRTPELWALRISHAHWIV